MNFIKSVLNGVDLKNWIENVCYVFKVASTLQAEAATVCITNQRKEKKRAVTHRWLKKRDDFKQEFGWTPTKWSWAQYDFWVARNPYVKWADAPAELHKIAREVGGYPQIFKIEKAPTTSGRVVKGDCEVRWDADLERREIDHVTGLSIPSIDLYHVETAFNLWKASVKRDDLDEPKDVLVCDPARTLRKSVLDSMRLSRCSDLRGNLFDESHFILIPAESLLLLSHVDLKNKPLVVIASGPHLKTSVVQSIVTFLDDKNDISIVQGETMVDREVYRLILKNFNITPKFYIALTPSHLIFDNSDKLKKSDSRRTKKVGGDDQKTKLKIEKTSSSANNNDNSSSDRSSGSSR